jgi:hypothetical protein
MMDEYEFEPVRGLPEIPPESEKVLWQGEPDRGGMIRRVFHARKVVIYFAILMTISAAAEMGAGSNLAQIAASVMWQFTMAVSALAVLCLLGWLYTRSTVYTITNQRLVMRFGVAIPMMINIPWSKIEAVNLRRFDDGSGDIEFTVESGKRMSYLMLWPNVKSWRFSPVTPALRSIKNADEVAARLSDLLQAKLRQTTQACNQPDASGDSRSSPITGAQSAAIS